MRKLMLSILAALTALASVAGAAFAQVATPADVTTAADYTAFGTSLNTNMAVILAACIAIAALAAGYNLVFKGVSAIKRWRMPKL